MSFIHQCSKYGSIAKRLWTARWLLAPPGWHWHWLHRWCRVTMSGTKRQKIQNERGFWWNEYDEHMYCVTCEHNLRDSIVIVYCDLCLPIVLILSPGLNCFQRLLKFRIFIARVLSPMRPYQALISWQIIVQTWDNYTISKLSLSLVPSLKRLTGPSLLLLPQTPPVEFPPYLFAASRVLEKSSQLPNTPWLQGHGQWTWYTSILQNLSPSNILIGRGTSMSMVQVCLFLFVPRCVRVCACA